jgi:cytoplasmic FMR1 interacting protein
MANLQIPDVDLLKKNDIYVDTIPLVVSHEYHPISIQPLSLAVAVELKSSSSSLEADYKAYFTTFPKELEFISAIDEFIRLGEEHIRMLYCYRSVSQAIPEISIETTDDMTTEEKTELGLKKTEINQKILDILRPEMNKIREFHAFTIDAIDCFYSCVSFVCYKGQHKEMIPEGFYLSLIRLLDVLLKLDNLKDFKNALRKDFARYKRAIGAHPSVELLEEITKLQNFLAGQDSRKSHHYIIHTLREEIKRINDHETLLVDCLDLTYQSLEEVLYFLPEEKFCFLRVIPYFILLIDGELDDTNKANNIFKNGKIKLSNYQKFFKRNPVVPLYGDITLTLELILQKAPHYEKSQAHLWGGINPSTNHVDIDQKVIDSYDIRTYWEQVRSSHSQYLIKFANAVNRYERFRFLKQVDEVTIEMAQDVYNLVTEGLQKVARWVMIIKSMLAWKYTHPYSREKLFAANTNADGNMDPLLNRDGLDYALALRHNLHQDEIKVFVDFVFMIKSLASHLLDKEDLFNPFIRFHIHHRIQQLVQGDLTPLLHRVDKRNKPILPTLLKLRSLGADWLNGNEPANDYKEYTRKQGTVVALNHPARVVGPALTQLYILRTQVASLCESKSEVRRKESIFGKADLEKSDVEIFQKFYDDSFYFPYLLNYAQHIKEITDLSDLWYREFFLELTKCIQFPIDMSLPWMLIENILSNKNSFNNKEKDSSNEGGNTVVNPTSTRIEKSSLSNNNMSMNFHLENVFYLFDIYNDAANKSLYFLNSQFLYDEIESEANLVIDQFYFLLSDEIYSYYKNLSGTVIIEKSYQLKYEEIKSAISGTNAAPPLSLPSLKYHHILMQKSVQMLGRSINLSMIFTQNITTKFMRDVDIAIKKFESYDIRGIVEFKSLLSILKLTHEFLSNYLLLDSFDHMLQEIDESWSTTAYRGRISLHILTSLARDVIPNFSYNQYTQRFIPSPIAIRPWEYNKPPKQNVIQSCYGNICYKHYENLNKLTRNFFGSVHIQALLTLEDILANRMTSSVNNNSHANSAISSNSKSSHFGFTQLTMIIDQLVKNLYDKIMDLSEYLSALKDSIPPCKPPQAIFKSIGAYGYFEGKLKSLLEFDDLKPEVFQIFREIGNTIAFLKDFSNVLEIHEGMNAFFITSLFPTSLASLTPLGRSSSGGRLAGEGENMNDNQSTSGDNVEYSPVMKVVSHMQKNLLNLTPNAANNISVNGESALVLKNSSVLQLVPLNIERQLQYYSSQYNVNAVPPNPAAMNNNNSVSSNNKNGKSLLKWLLLQLEEFLYQQNFTTEWSAFSEENVQQIMLVQQQQQINAKNNASTPGGRSSSTSVALKKDNFVIEIENSISFSKMWSALCFLFCINEQDEAFAHAQGSNSNDPDDPDASAHNPSPGTLTNFAEFGHGFSIAGIVFLHLLGQKSLFELLDYTHQVIAHYDFELEMNENLSSMTSNLDASLVQEYTDFIREGKKLMQMNQEWFQYFHSVYQIRPSYSKYSSNRNVFHPPEPPVFSFK